MSIYIPPEVVEAREFMLARARDGVEMLRAVSERPEVRRDELDRFWRDHLWLEVSRGELITVPPSLHPLVPYLRFDSLSCDSFRVAALPSDVFSFERALKLIGRLDAYTRYDDRFRVDAPTCMLLSCFLEKLSPDRDASGALVRFNIAIEALLERFTRRAWAVLHPRGGGPPLELPQGRFDAEEIVRAYCVAERGASRPRPLNTELLEHISRLGTIVSNIYELYMPFAARRFDLRFVWRWDGDVKRALVETSHHFLYFNWLK